jgi:hypothetical protein
VSAVKLAAGAVTVTRDDDQDWPAMARKVAGVLRAHRAPLMLEVHPPHRPEPVTLASLTEGLLAGGAVAAA